MAGLEEAGSWMWLWGQHQLLRDHDRMTADPELPAQEYGTRCFLSALYKLRGASGKVIYLLSTYSCLFVSPASCQYLHLCFLGRDCFAAAFSQAWSEQLRAAFAQVSCSQLQLVGFMLLWSIAHLSPEYSPMGRCLLLHRLSWFVTS